MQRKCIIQIIYSYDKNKEKLMNYYTPSYKPKINKNYRSTSQKKNLSYNSVPTSPSSSKKYYPLVKPRDNKSNKSSEKIAINNLDDEGLGWIKGALGIEDNRKTQSNPVTPLRLTKRKENKSDVWYRYLTEEGFPYYYNPSNKKTVWKLPKNVENL